MKPYDYFVDLQQNKIFDRIKQMDGFFASKLGFDGKLHFNEYDEYFPDANGTTTKNKFIRCSLDEVKEYSFQWHQHEDYTYEPGWFEAISEKFYQLSDNYHGEGYSLSRTPSKFNITWFNGNGWQSYEFIHNAESMCTTWYWLHVDDDDHMLEFLLTEN
jgi:hypothetical protein